MLDDLKGAGLDDSFMAEYHEHLKNTVARMTDEETRRQVAQLQGPASAYLSELGFTEMATDERAATRLLVNSHRRMRKAAIELSARWAELPAWKRSMIRSLGGGPPKAEPKTKYLGS